MINFTCGCGKRLQVADKFTGKKVKCPGCGQIALVPVSDGAAFVNQATAALHKPASPPDAGKPTTRPAPDNPEATVASVRRAPAQAQGDSELQSLGGYRIVRLLGQGGMGAVYEAEDVKLERRVALKVMRPEVASNVQHRERFLREARTAAKVKNDFICAIYQVGEENDIPFIAMPFLKGEPLDTHLKKGMRLATEEVVRIGKEIAEGLSAAHEVGLIHRDIKPANVWLETQRSGPPRAVILDFGLARMQGDDVQLTQTGMIVGTPAYMSPEQAQGDKKSDGRTDLFSLGCVLYALCTGELPFKGETTMGILMALAAQQPTPPHAIAASTPRPLSDLIMRLLAKNPNDRPTTARDVVAELAAIEVGLARPAQAIPTRPTTTADPAIMTGQTEQLPAAAARSTSRRKAPYALIAAGALGLLVVLGGVYYIATHKTTREPKKEAVAEEKQTPPVPPVEDKKVDPDRRAAEYVLSVGGYICINDDPDARPTTVLPREAFRLTAFHGGYQNQKLNDAGFANFKDCKHLTVISLWETWNVHDAGLAYFKDCKNLKVLSLVNIAFTDEGIANFKGCKNLTTLTLAHIPVTDAGLANFKDCKNLKELGVGNTRVSNAGLAHFKDCKDLNRLGLTHNINVSDEGLANFKDCKNLTILELGETSVTDAGLALFKDCKMLTNVSLFKTRVGDVGLAHLKDCKNLTTLVLSGTQVSDAGIALFKECRDMNDLRLDDTQVSNAILPQLKEYKNLGLLMLQKTKVTPAGIDELKKALPKCKIEWDGGVVEPK